MLGDRYQIKGNIQVVAHTEDNRGWIIYIITVVHSAKAWNWANIKKSALYPSMYISKYRLRQPKTITTKTTTSF